MRRMIVDTSNLFWRSVSAQQRYGSPDASASAGLGLHMCLMSLRKHWQSIKPDKLAIVFEGRQNWRKTYTKSEECYSKRLYKGNREADPSMAVLFDILRAFEDLAREHTSIVTLAHPLLEGDDLIAGYTQHFSEQGDEIFILSGDKDFVQLLGKSNVHLVNPDDGKERTLTGVCNVDDAGYFMFEKCIRGDAGDNVLPAYPKIRTTRLHKAYGVVDGKVLRDKDDAFEMSNIFAHEWDFVHPDTGEKRKMSVEKMFNENSLLMDLTAQPPEIRAIIDEVIAHESEHHGKFDFFKFNKFLGTYELKQIAERSTDFVDMFNGKTFQRQEPAKAAPAPEVEIPGFGF